MPVILGFDYGRRRIGVAVSDPGGSLASAWGVHRTPDDGPVRDLVARLVAERGVAEIVVGLPLTADGRETEMAGRVRRFAEVLREQTGLPVHLCDERFSSREARAYLNAGGRRRRPRGEVDAVAAEIILQQFLDARAASHRDAPEPEPGEESP